LYVVSISLTGLILHETVVLVDMKRSPEKPTAKDLLAIANN